MKDRRVPAEDMQAKESWAAHVAMPTHITSIGIPTCDRVEALRGSIISYLENCQRFGRSPEFVVVDDSRSPTTREAYRQMLRGLRERYDMSIAYAGLEEKEAFVHKLSEVGKIPEEVVSWACLGDSAYRANTHGANRNALLLHTIGEYIFSSDDDVICRIAASPGYQEGLALSSQRNPSQYWFYPDRETALESVRPVERDILALHEQWLGHDPKAASVPYRRAGKISLEQAEPGFLLRLATQPGRIALTTHGVIGDVSHRASDLLFFNPAESFERLVSSEQAYRSARSSREVAQVAKQLTLTAKSYPLIGMCIGGLDNRELLPPFPPVGRDEDTAFGIMLNRCFPDTYAVSLPWVLLHAPPEARTYADPSFDLPFDSWLPRCIALFHLEQPGMPTDHLSQLGQFLEHIGRLPVSAFEEVAHQIVWETEKECLSLLEQRLHKGEGLHVSWKRDAEAYAARARESMALPIKQRLQGGAELAQRSLVQFAQILHWWPVMVETARCLRAQSCRVAQPI